MRVIVLAAFVFLAGHDAVSAQTTQAPIPADTVITLERVSDAFNHRRDYRVTVTADGNLVLQQVKDLKLLDPVKATLPVEKVRQLISEFQNVNFFALNERYAKREDGCPEEWTDAGGAATSITINGKSKKVYHYYGCKQDQASFVFPKELFQLEKQIDEIIEAERWLK